MAAIPNQSIAGVIGDPVEHSRSPAMHNAAFAHLGIAARYERWHTPAAELPARIASLRNEMILGANVTLPHKIAVLDLVDHRDPEVDLIGAANTIIREADGTLTAANTDAPAVLATLRDDANFAAAGRSVLILGASGAARAAAYALIQANISSLTVINRTLLRAEELLADLIESTQTQIPIFAYSNDDSELAEAIAGIDLIINATSIGWQNDQTPLDKQYIRPHMLVFDMVYRSTRLLHEATAQGAQTLNGKGMLVRQAGLAFQRWTNQPAPINVMMHAFDQENR
ncbi:MAG: shikimate dehydrogenase [Roseiflexaceae bacterium]|nr:shikimate dehydrogenase [Roseiflexaceae bacterium]